MTSASSTEEAEKELDSLRRRVKSLESNVIRWSHLTYPQNEIYVEARKIERKRRKQSGK